MSLDSRSQFGDKFDHKLSEEYRNGLIELRYLPWSGKPLNPGDRIVVQMNDNGRTGRLYMPITEDAQQVLLRSYAVVKNYFLEKGKRVKMISFIQERKPNKLGLTLENIGSGLWHNHLKESEQNALIVLDDEVGTDFIEGELEVADEANVTASEVAAALQSGKAEQKRLDAGQVGHFTNKTLHKRAAFHSDDPRVAIVVEFED